MTAPAFPKPHAALEPNTPTFESLPLVKPTGFREYDARWWFGHPGSSKPPELNLMGVQAIGLGLTLAVALDATVVRLLLVPATMTIAGRYNWWAPAPLRRLHDRLGLSEPAQVPGGAKNSSAMLSRSLTDRPDP